MITVKCIVAGINASGEPDLFFTKIICRTQNQIDEGEHYERAVKAANDEGYEAKLAYDEFDSAGKAMLPLFVWESASEFWIEP